jgi:hypothetical protein
MIAACRNFQSPDFIPLPTKELTLYIQIASDPYAIGKRVLKAESLILLSSSLSTNKRDVKSSFTNLSPSERI